MGFSPQMLNTSGSSEVRPVIWSTDWSADCDDAMAARVLLWAERSRVIDLLCAVVSTSDANNAPSLDAYLQAEGRPGLPIGVDLSGPTKAGPYQATLLTYNTYPRQYTSVNTMESDVSLMRRSIVNASSTVDIVSTGSLNTIANLLNSPADSYSSLSGVDLIKQKCGTLWIMGGDHPTGSEFNFTLSPTGTQTVLNTWPNKAVFLGYGLGNGVVSGNTLQDYLSSTTTLASALTSGTAYTSLSAQPLKKDIPSGSTVTLILGSTTATVTTSADSAVGSNSLAINSFTPSASFPVGTLIQHSSSIASDDILYMVMNAASASNGRPSWDPLTALIGCYGDAAEAGYSLLRGTNTSDSSGNNTFTQNTTGSHYYVQTTHTSNWYINQLNNIFEKRAWPTGKVGKAQVSKVNRISNVVDVSNLVAQWDATDSNGADGRYLEDRTRTLSNGLYVQTGTTPTVQSTSSKYALTNGTMQTVGLVEFESSMTIYMKVLITATPAVNYTLMQQSNLWIVNLNTDNTVTTGIWSSGASAHDWSGSSLALSANAWHVITMVVTPTLLTTYIDGTADAGTTLTSVDTGASVVQLSPDSVTNVHEVRIYKGAHSASTISSVIAQMD